MLTVKNFDVASVDFLLFNNDTGACRRIDMLSESESESLTQEFELIDKIILTNDIQNDPGFTQITEKFMDWGCGFIAKQISKNSNINRAREIISHLDFLHDLLPINSPYLNKSFFNRDQLMLIFDSIQANFRKHPADYLKVLFNIWTFCEKEIKNPAVFCSTLKCVYECLKSTFSNDYITDLFQYADHVLTLHLSQINSKISDKLVIDGLLTIVKVVVRNETQAICRLHFWWRLICSFQPEMMSIKIFDPCVIPFLANLFGKYISLDSDAKFPYSVYTYNVFTNYAELGALCNHAMSQLLRVVSSSASPHMEKSTKFDNIKHWNVFAGILLTTERINQLLIGFYYWCQSITLNKSKSSPTDFQLLEVIFKCFSERFIVECQIKQQTCCRNESDNANLTPTFYMVIDKILDFKLRLEQDNKKSAVVLFSERLRISKVIIENLLKLGDNTSIIPIGFKLLLRVFYDNLETMNKFVLSAQQEQQGIITTTIQRSKCISWVECSENIVNLIFPKNSLAFSLIMSNDMTMINKYWFHGWFNNNHFLLDRNVAIANLQCWFLLSSKLGQRLDKDSFTNFSNDSSVAVDGVTPFVEYLVAPILFITEFNGCVMIKNDYDEIWKSWEYLYVDVITKATFIPDFSITSWLRSICPLLSGMFSKITNRNRTRVITNQNAANDTIVFNMICRSLRSVVLRTDDDEKIDKKHPFWKLLVNICDNFPIFSPNNLRLSCKDLPSSSSNNSSDDLADGILKDLSLTPVGKWAKLKLPFAARFPCDLESNFDTFLSLITLLIYKITHKKCFMLDIVDILVPKMSLLSDALVGRKLQNENLKTNSRNRQVYDENTVQLENFLTYLIGRIEICCLKETITTDIFEKLSPLLIYLFANEHGVFSRSTVTRVISFWNDEIGCVENLHYSPEMLKAIKKLKLSNKLINIPDNIEEKIKDLNVSFELIHQDSSSLSEEPKIAHYGSILSKVIEKEKRNSLESKKEIDRSMCVDDEDTIIFTPTKIVSSNKTPPTTIPVLSETTLKEITPKKATPVKLLTNIKEFYSPAKEVVKRSSRKRPCFDFLRKSSETEYVPIAPQKNKRIRLTDHQKEAFNEQKNEYKPFINNDLENVTMMNLIRNDSTISLSSNDSLLNRINSIDESVTDRLPVEMTNNNNDDNANANVSSVAEILLDNNTCSAGIVATNNQLDIDIDMDMMDNLPQDTPSLELSLVSNNHHHHDHHHSPSDTNIIQQDKENLPVDSQPLPPPLTKRLSVVLDKYPLLDLININQISCFPANESELKSTGELSKNLLQISNEKQDNSVISVVSETGNVLKPVINLTESPIFQRSAFTNYQSPLPIPRKILNPSNSTTKFKSRTQRVVQLAMENKIKKDNLPKPPVTSASNTDVPTKPGIIRNFWSERKNNRVSFSIPLDNSENDAIKEETNSLFTIENEYPVVNNEEMFQSQVVNNEEMFQSPVVNNEEMFQSPVVNNEEMFQSPVVNNEEMFQSPVVNNEEMFQSPVVNNEEMFQSPVVNNEEMFQSPVKRSNITESNSSNGFLSPVPVRTNNIILPQMSDLTSELNNSLVEPQSLEKTRQTLKDIVDQFSPIKDHSQSIVERTIDHVKQALNIASAENQKEILRQLMSIIMSKM